MALVLDYTPEQEARLAANAARRGLTLPEYLLQIDDLVNVAAPALDREQWAEELVTAFESLPPPPRTPLLSELTREVFYQENE